MAVPIQTIINSRSFKPKTPPFQWWGYVWRGLVVSRSGKHYKKMGRSVWLFLYFIIHANRKTGTLYRRINTISRDIGMSNRTVQVWLKTLRDSGYVATERTGRSLIINICNWRPIRPLHSSSQRRDSAPSNRPPIEPS